MKKHHVFKNTYFDSVTLMRTSNDIKSSLNFNELVMLMATDMNKDMIKSVGLYHPDFDQAEANDLLVAADMNQPLDNWTEQIIDWLSQKNKKTSDQTKTFSTLNQAINQIDPNIAIVSVPGIYAAHEAFKALENNMHVMIFSDNVSIDDEIKLKDYAIKKDLLVMGPDCGTAIINGVGLCFANKVRAGSIGLVAASGTGLQEVSVIIDKYGGGITQAIGVGGRDLSKEVSGRMTLHAIDALNDDPKTEIIVIISKPPHPDVTKKLLEKLQGVKKPVVLCLLDAQMTIKNSHIHPTSNLTETALKALELSNIKTPDLLTLTQTENEWIKAESSKYNTKQTKLKALYCGGTLAAETLSLVRPFVKNIHSNVAKKLEEQLTDPLKSDGHQIIDLGDDIFTRGKPHPMIEPSIRNERIILEAKNPETRVILLDFELGYGSHEDPVGISLPAIIKSKVIAKKYGRHISFISHICGSKQDAQNLDNQIAKLKEQGVIVAATNAHAALIAANLVKEV